MALSEQEQNMLEQLERQFKRDDPKFVESMEAGRAPSPAPWILTGVLVALTGIVVLLLGTTLPHPVAAITVGSLGFAMLTAGGYVATARIVRTRPKLPSTSAVRAFGGDPPPANDPRFRKGGLGDAAFWNLFWWI